MTDIPDHVAFAPDEVARIEAVCGDATWQEWVRSLALSILANRENKHAGFRLAVVFTETEIREIKRAFNATGEGAFGRALASRNLARMVARQYLAYLRFLAGSGGMERALSDMAIEEQIRTLLGRREDQPPARVVGLFEPPVAGEPWQAIAFDMDTRQLADAERPHPFDAIEAAWLVLNSEVP